MRADSPGLATVGRPALCTTLFLICSAAGPPLAAQSPAVLNRERQEFATWLETAPLSPYAILAMQPVGAGISIGYEPSDIPLPVATRGIAREARGAIVLEQGGKTIPLPRGRPVRLEQFTLVGGGAPGRAVVAAYGAVRRFHPPSFYPFDSAGAIPVHLDPPERRGSFRVLGPDGLETDATEAGRIEVMIGGTQAHLRVYRLGSADDDESELTIFFRDGTSGHGSYPAGRFVSLEPSGPGRYRLDFNRARNPFCAYSTVYPCPAPWPGNTIAVGVEAGERYGEEKP